MVSFTHSFQVASASLNNPISHYSKVSFTHSFQVVAASLNNPISHYSKGVLHPLLPGCGGQPDAFGKGWTRD
jgi:hypothetical protein